MAEATDVIRRLQRENESLSRQVHELRERLEHCNKAFRDAWDRAEAAEAIIASEGGGHAREASEELAQVSQAAQEGLQQDERGKDHERPSGQERTQA